MPKDNLFSTKPVATKQDNTPLVVVGLPRSGSSFLCEVISQIEGWYVFDDLYVHRKAIETGATGTLSEAQLDNLLFFLGWQIRARLRHGKYAIPNVTEAEIEDMNASIKTALSGTNPTWADLQEEWMCRLATRSDCENWGYKMPQAFRYLDQLFELYPNMRVIFLMRTPQDVLASYKYMRSDSEDGDAAQYHPLSHAVYWRMAAKSYLDAKAKFKDKVMLLKFEDLVAEPNQAARQVASFLDTKVPEGVDIPSRPNSSFRTNGKRQSLNGLELSLLDKIAGDMRDELGFDAAKQKLSASDFVDFTKTSLVFTNFRIKKFVSTKLQKSAT